MSITRRRKNVSSWGGGGNPLKKSMKNRKQESFP